MRRHLVATTVVAVSCLLGAAGIHAAPTTTTSVTETETTPAATTVPGRPGGAGTKGDCSPDPLKLVLVGAIGHARSLPRLAVEP